MKNMGLNHMSVHYFFQRPKVIIFWKFHVFIGANTILYIFILNNPDKDQLSCEA